MKRNAKNSFTVFVKHLNQYSRKFIVNAKSEYFARQMVREIVSAHPLDQRNGTFDGTHLTINVNKLPEFEAELLRLTDAEQVYVATNDVVASLPTERMLRIAVGTTMKSLRQHMDASQREFAVRAGLRQPTVGVLERGETGVRLYNFFEDRLCVR